jgi:SAM-dependent methyltransferase
MRHLEATFRLARKKWGGNGSGSSPEKTAQLVAGISNLIGELGVKSVLDLGCGELTWMAPIAAQVRYVGVDVVGEVVELNRTRHPGAEFIKLAEDTVLPRCDLVVCRDTLAHLANQLVTDTLKMLKRTGATYLLTSNYKSGSNTSIKDGAFRPLNLMKIPFSFPEPRQIIEEGFEQKAMMLWRFADILPDVASPPRPEVATTPPPARDFPPGTLSY